MAATLGRTVLYTLTETEADAINKRRADFQAYNRNHAQPIEPGEPGSTGHQAHYGNSACAGQQYPATVVRAFDDGAVNLRVLLDGSDTYWATSATEGDGPGHWAWPPLATGGPVRSTTTVGGNGPDGCYLAPRGH